MRVEIVNRVKPLSVVVLIRILTDNFIGTSDLNSLSHNEALFKTFKVGWNFRVRSPKAKVSIIFTKGALDIFIAITAIICVEARSE